MKRFVLDQIIDMWGTNKSGLVRIHKDVMVFSDEEFLDQTISLIDFVPNEILLNLVAINITNVVNVTLPNIEFLWEDPAVFNAAWKLFNKQIIYPNNFKISGNGTTFKFYEIYDFFVDKNFKKGASK